MQNDGKTARVGVGPFVAPRRSRVEAGRLGAMLNEALDALLDEEEALRSLAIFDDLGNEVAAVSREGDGGDVFAPVVSAWLAVHGRGLQASELRVETDDLAFIARSLGHAFVVAAARLDAPLGRIAMRMRLHDDALRGALP
jgi:hypothetical protein